MGLSLNNIVPWGRSFAEYRKMFDLTPGDLKKNILDCGGGPASFVAELAAGGGKAVAADPIYAFSSDDIRNRFEAVADGIIAQVREAEDDWVWNFHKDPDELLATRREALETFLKDYARNAQTARYVEATLPNLPFAEKEFELALCSHLLLLYSEILSEEFHILATREICRVAKEVRIFPILSLKGELSPHLHAVQKETREQGWSWEVRTVDYELMRGGNQMLRLFRN